MAEESRRSVLEVIGSDPLRAVTRKERTYLLGLSLAGVVVATTGLIPTEISNLGITFTPKERTAFLAILAGVIGYYLVAFLMYALTDVAAWSWALHSAAATGADNFVRDTGPVEAQIAAGIITGAVGTDENVERVYRQLTRGDTYAASTSHAGKLGAARLRPSVPGGLRRLRNHRPAARDLKHAFAPAVG